MSRHGSRAVFFSLLLGDALLQQFFLGVLPHELAIHEHIVLATMNESFHLCSIARDLSYGEVLDELLSPIKARGRHH